MSDKNKTHKTAADGSVARADLFCECVNWCRNGRDMFSPHHPRCEHSQQPPTDPRYAVFGKLMWEMIKRIGGEFCWDEWSEDVLPLAQRAGLCRRVIYDPEKHGDGIDAEPGCEIWYWGDADISHNAERRHEPMTDTQHRVENPLPPSPGSAWRYDEPQQQDGQMCCTLREQVAVPRGDLFHGGWTYESWKLIRAGMPWMTIEDAEKYNDDHGPIPQPDTDQQTNVSQ